MKRMLLVSLIIMMSFPIVASGKSDSEKLLEVEIITNQQASLPLEEGISRGEFVSIVNKTFDIYTTIGDKFTDSTSDNLYYYDLMAAKTNGYLTAYEDGSIKSDELVTRNEAALMFDRLLDLPQPTSEPRLKGDDILTRGEAYESLMTIIDLDLNTINSYEMMQITSFDGYNLTGRLSIPNEHKKIEKLVIFVDGSGANTYKMRREWDDVRFNYVDLFANEAAKQGVAYFSYNTRGVHTSDENPFYTIDDEEYKTYTPTNVAKDLVVMLDELRKDSRLKDAEIYLLGWSEGATVAPLAVTEYDLVVDGLLLAGYANENIREILDWQLGGDMTFFVYSIYFSSETEGAITKEEYEADPHNALQTVFGGATFEQTDADKDGVISANDFKVLNESFHTALLNAVENNDHLWLTENYPVNLTPEWFKDHFSLGKTEDLLAQVDIPIYIFHGALDLNCPVSGVHDAEERFKALNKTNLHINVYEGHDHDLNFTQWLYTGEMPEGIKGIFDTVNAL